MSPGFTRDIQRAILWIPRFFLSAYSYRTITLYGATFQSTSDSPRRKYRVHQHHTYPSFRRGIRFTLCRVRSPLLTASRLISFPAGTRMFRSPAFPVLTERSEEQEVPLGNHRIIGSLHLPGAYRSLARPSSALEPSHSPDDVAMPLLCRLNTRPGCV